jgi:hypothetical protein
MPSWARMTPIHAGYSGRCRPVKPTVPGHESVMSLQRTFRRRDSWAIAYRCINEGKRMSASGQQPVGRAESFMEAAQREMIAFEIKERDFRKRTKQEEAQELHLPLDQAELH